MEGIGPVFRCHPRRREACYSCEVGPEGGPTFLFVLACPRFRISKLLNLQEFKIQDFGISRNLEILNLGILNLEAWDRYSKIQEFAQA